MHNSHFDPTDIPCGGHDRNLLISEFLKKNWGGWPPRLCTMIYYHATDARCMIRANYINSRKPSNIIMNEKNLQLSMAQWQLSSHAKNNISSNKTSWHWDWPHSGPDVLFHTLVILQTFSFLWGKDQRKSGKNEILHYFASSVLLNVKIWELKE